MLNFQIDQQRAGGSIREIMTSIGFDPTQLNETDYAERINAGLPEPLVLGGEAIVLADWPGARGLELKELRPATEEAEAQLRKEFREYMLQVRQMNIGARPRASIAKLRGIEAEIARLKAEIEAEGPAKEEVAKAFEPAFKKLTDGIIAQCGYVIDYVNERIAELKA